MFNISRPLSQHPQSTSTSCHSMAGLSWKYTASGADISAAGEETLHLLGEHPSKPQPSTVVPRAVNRTTIKPLGKITINLQLGTRKHCENLQVYPSISEMLISWKAAKGLGILHHSCAVNNISQQHRCRLWPTSPHRMPSISLSLTHRKGTISAYWTRKTRY